MDQSTNPVTKKSIREKLFAKISVLKFSVLVSIGILLILFLVGLTISFTAYRFNSYHLKQNLPFEEGSIIMKDDPNLPTLLNYSHNGISLNLDYKTTNVRVFKDGKVFETIPYDYFNKVDLSILSEGQKYKINDFSIAANDQYRSPIDISYIVRGKEKAEHMNGFTLSVKDGHFKVYKLTNGFRVEYDIAAREVDKSWIPNAVETKEFNKIYDDATNQEKSHLNNVYDIKDGQNLVRIRPNFNKKSLHEVYKLWTDKYKLTDEELIKRNAKVGGKNWIIKKPRFVVPVEYRLIEENLQVTVLTDKIKELSPNVGELSLKLSDIYLLPNFTKVRSKAHASEETFCFIPDGSGAIIKPKFLENNSLFYDKAFYNSDSLKLKNINTTDHLSTIYMPFYGTYDYEQAVLADIVSGTCMARLTTKELSHIFKLTTSFNLKAFDRYEFVKGQKVNVYDKTNTTDRIITNYYLLTANSGKHLTYFDFVKQIQNVYFRNSLLQKDSKILELEVVGAFNKQQHFLGIPYYKDNVLTSYQDFLKLRSSYQDKKILFKYSGFSSGGINGKSQEKIYRSKSLGKYKYLKDITKTDTFFDVYLLNYYYSNDGRFKNNRHGVRLMGGNTYSFSDPNRRDLSSTLQGTNKHYLLAPNYMQDKITSFSKNNKDFKYLALRDLGSTFLRNYTTLHTSGDESLNIQCELISSLLSDKKVMLNAPFFPASKLANVLENIPTSSSERTIFYASIPFYSLVISPYIPVYSTNLNVDEERNTDELITTLLASNMYGKFIVSKNNTASVKDSADFNYLYAISLENELLQKNIQNTYDELKKYYDKTSKLQLVNHELISPKVFLLTYDNGEKILFNESSKECTYLTYTIPPYGKIWL